GLAIGGGELIVSSFGQSEVPAPPAAIEEGFGEFPSDGPEAVWKAEQIGEFFTRSSDRAVQVQGGKICGLCDADLFVGHCDGAYGGRDSGPALRQRGRDSRGNRRNHFCD